MRFFYLKETSTDIAADWIFEKFKLIHKTLFSCTFGGDWGENFKNGLTFVCLRKKKDLNFDLKISFFMHKRDFVIFAQSHMDI